MINTYFISGHRDASLKEFEEHYIPILEKLIRNGNKFLVGDCPGIDSFAIDYLSLCNLNEFPDEDVTVYHIGNKPMHNRSFKTVGGFISDFYRDYTMTLNSDFDVCWVRKIRSGTQLNVERRKWIQERKSKKLSYSYNERMMMEANLFL